MVSVMKKRKSTGMAVRKAVGMILGIVGLFVAGAAMAAVWYGQYR